MASRCWPAGGLPRAARYEALRLVHHQRRDLTVRAAIDQILLEPIEKNGLGLCGLRAQVETGRQGIDELRPGQRGIPHVHAPNVATALRIQHCIEQCGLSGAGLADQHRQRLGREQAIFEIAERLAVPGRQIEKFGVRRQLEWQTLKLVMALIHRRLPDSRSSAIQQGGCRATCLPHRAETTTPLELDARTRGAGAPSARLARQHPFQHDFAPGK